MATKARTADDDALADAMQSLRKPRANAQTQEPPARPQTVSAKSKPVVAKAKAKPKKPASAPEPILVPEIGENDDLRQQNGIKLKDQLTAMEAKFIELYLSGQLSVDKAMIAAGYEGYHPNSLYRLGRKIVQKYESSAGDHRKIMRAMGYGETKAIEMLIDSAKNAKSDMVKLNARIALAKCLGLNNDVIQTHLGVNIIITGRSQHQPAAEPIEGGGRPALMRQEQPKDLPMAISITK